MLLQRLSRTFFWLALALYLGGIITLGAIVAPALAQTVRQDHVTYPSLPTGLDMDRQTIGQLFGPLLYRFLYVEMACAGVMAVAIAIETWVGGQHASTPNDAPSAPRFPISLKIRSFLLLIVLALLAYDAFQLTPSVWHARNAWRTAASTNPAAAHGALEDQFNILHIRSENLGHAKVYALLALLVVTAWSIPRKGQPTSPKA